ncbi:MAG: EAL domain-containing protein [Rhizobacter sp.]|nr:EAL domain-containing protein [Rhizobacter sp.]
MNAAGTLDPSAPLAAPPAVAGGQGVDTLVKLRLWLISAVLLMLAVLGTLTWFLIQHSQQQLIEFKALSLAEVVARQAASARTVYTEHVAAKLARDGSGKASEGHAHEPGNVPLPAQFLKLVGRQASRESGGLFRYQPLSLWNLGEGQGLSDEFQRWAWSQLEAQGARAARGEPVNWRSIWRVEDVAGEPTLRMMRADPASGDACVACHNTLEARPATIARRLAQGVAPGKRWQKHDLMGALEVQVPLSNVEALAANQRRNLLAIVFTVALAGAAIIGGLVFAGTAQARRLHDRLAWHAGHDSLTRLPNRRQFEERLGHLLRDARSNGTVHCLLFLDLDRFKFVNDAGGHNAGDKLLQQLSQRLRSELRAADMLARIGGDEFGVLLTGCPIEHAAEVAQKLIHATGELRFSWNGRSYDVGLSAGLVEVHRDSGDALELLAEADMACYAAKEDGRNRVRIFRSSDAEMARRRGQLDLAEELTGALVAGRMALAVQTARALDPGLPIQAYQEVLLRVYDADGQPISTGAAIAAAERMNLMSTRIDRWVLQSTCWHMASGRLKTGGSSVVAVNLSAQSLCDEGFLEFALDAIRGSGIEPSALCIEITETSAMANLARATHFMSALKSLGVRFALDDFGAGLSSFAYLKNLPVDFLKLDGAFVRDILGDASDRALVGAMASLGRALSIPTIAEWVENEAVREQLAQMGIDYAQGWGIERPRAV